jgi:hypothetical protein
MCIGPDSVRVRVLIVYLSTDAGQPLTAVLERSTYVPALNDASCNGCDEQVGALIGPGRPGRAGNRRELCALAGVNMSEAPENRTRSSDDGFPGA